MGLRSEDFDVAIVGARCAGAPLATMLAKRGMRVCLLDRAKFPSDTPSTHVIQPSGVMALTRLGVLDDLYAAGAVPITRLTLVDEDVRIDAEFGADTFGAPGISIRRVILDDLLVRAAAAAGAEVRTGSSVVSMIREDGRVAGVVTGRASARARLVVGADGRRSTVADLVGSVRYRVTPPGRVFAWAYFDGVSEAEGHLRLGRIGDLALLASPTDGGLHMAGACPPQAARTEFLADREAALMAGLDTWPELAELLAGSRRVGPIRTVANWDGFLRQAAGPGWALLGDAGHFKDPTPAQGISDALRQAEHLADAIEAGLGGLADLGAELDRWWRWRDRDASEMYRFASDMGTSLSPMIAREVLGEVAADPDATLKFLRLLNHDIVPGELFTAGRIARGVGAGGAASTSPASRPRRGGRTRGGERAPPFRPPAARPLGNATHQQIPALGLANRVELGAAGGDEVSLLVPDAAADADQAVAGQRRFVVDEEPLCVRWRTVEPDRGVEIGGDEIDPAVFHPDRGPAEGVKQDQRPRGIDERVGEHRRRLEPDPLADHRLGLAHPHLRCRTTAGEVVPERVELAAVLAPPLDGPRGLRRLHDGTVDLLVRVTGPLGGRQHQGEQDVPPALGHPHRECLRAPAPFQSLDLDLHPVELRLAEEMAVVADRARNSGVEPRRPERQRREVAATWAPDLPIVAELDRVGAVRSLELRRRVERDRLTVRRPH